MTRTVGPGNDPVAIARGVIVTARQLGADAATAGRRAGETVQACRDDTEMAGTLRARRARGEVVRSASRPSPGRNRPARAA